MLALARRTSTSLRAVFNASVRATSSTTNLATAQPLETDFEHPSDVAVDPNSVQQGLSMDNAMKCPFLSEIHTQLSNDEETAISIRQGAGVPSHRMKSFIDDALYKVLNDLRSQRRYREFRYFKRAVGAHPEVVRHLDNQQQTLINWCSNDYLNMAHDPVVLSAMQQTLLEQGAGAGGTRNISGSNITHIELEAELAALCHTEAALIFGSCYTANLGVMEALSGALSKDTIIFSDEENHASLVQGIRNTRLAKRIFEHNNVEHLAQLLAEAPESAPKIVIFESVYSMSGTRAPVTKLLDLCEQYGAISVIDEVHAVGLYGTEGGGILDALNMRGRADIVTGTLGKAFGVSGGFVAAKAHWVDVIRSTAPSFIFTTSMPPHVASGSKASVQQVRKLDLLRQQLHRTALYLKHEMLEAGLPLMSTETHILPLKVGEGELCKKLADDLLDRGIYVQPINYPSVPRGQDLLRFTVSPKHTKEHCDYLAATLTELFDAHGLLDFSSREEVACICGKPQACDMNCCPILRSDSTLQL